jgi:molybdate transport system substrate-binding protein
LPALRIFAAGSLRTAFDRLAAAGPEAPALVYANARDLAQRITDGEPTDAFASASEHDPRRLHDAGLVDEPRAFATNHLVVAVAESSAARDVSVLAADGTRLVIEVDGIPAGVYTRRLLADLDALHGGDFAKRALANVIAQEQTVDAVADRILSGDADAGVLYATDVLARRGELRAIEPPPEAAVAATFVACAVTASDRHEQAAAWLDALTVAPASTILRDVGFGPAPAPPSRMGRPADHLAAVRLEDAGEQGAPAC